MRSPARSLPFGTMAGMITLLIAAALTWYVCASLLPWQYLGFTYLPALRRGAGDGQPVLEFLLFWGTVLSAVASANGCINDAARAWFSLGRDRYLPTLVLGGASEVPHALSLDPVPDAHRAGLRLHRGPNQAITFSILSGVLHYTFMSINIVMFRNKWPVGSIRRGYTHPVPSDAGDRAVHAMRDHDLRDLPRLRLAAERHGDLLHHRVAMVSLLPLQVSCAAATSSPCRGRSRRDIERGKAGPPGRRAGHRMTRCLK